MLVSCYKVGQAGGDGGLCLLYSIVAATDDFEGLLAEAAAVGEDGAEAVVVFGFGEARLFFGGVFPKAEEDVKRAVRGIENVSAERQIQPLRVVAGARAFHFWG